MLKTSSQTIALPAQCRVLFRGEGSFSIFSVDEAGEIDDLVAASLEGKAMIFCEEECKVFVKILKGLHWTYKVVTRADVAEKVAPIPVAIPEGMKVPPTLKEQMRAMVGEMLRERYGDSQEVETFEESMDFELDEDGLPPLSGYEVREMDEVPPPPDPPAEQSSAEQPPHEAGGTGEEKPQAPATPEAAE